MEVGDIAIMKKPHPCGNNEFTVVRVGADVKIQCNKCERIVMIDRPVFEKRVKKIESK